MNSTTLVAITVAFVFTSLIDSVSAWYGTVTFYQNINFKGSTFPWGISKTQHCYNLSCWNDKASSVKWEGLPEGGDMDGKSRIAFFTGKDCTGDVRHWATEQSDHSPKDFTLDKVNDQISSFMIWEKDKKTSNGIDTPCPWGTS